MTDWDERYRAGDMPWEKGHAAPPLRELLDKTDPELWGTGPVLVPGCGFGHDARELAGLGIPVLGLDLAATAVESARSFGGTAFARFETGDFLDPAWHGGLEFSAIWEHTCFCAIDPADRDRYARAAAACLPPGAILAGVFFLTPHDPGDDEAGPPFGTSIAELDARFAADFERIGGWVPEAAYPGREGREWIGLFRRRETRFSSL